MTEKHTQAASPPGTQMVDEAVLVSRAKNDPQAFEALYSIYVQPVFRYLCSRLGSVPDAEDVTAQTFLAALEGFQCYRHNGHFAAWLFSIARRKTVDHYRQQRRQLGLHQRELSQLESEGSSPSQWLAAQEDDPLLQVIRREQFDALAQHVQSLPEKERDLLRLRYVAELSFSEIGRLLGRREDAVKKAFYRLLGRLQNQLEVSHD